MDFDAKSSPQHWRLQDILLYLNNKSKRDTAAKDSSFHPYVGGYFNVESAERNGLSRAKHSQHQHY